MNPGTPSARKPQGIFPISTIEYTQLSNSLSKTESPQNKSSTKHSLNLKMADTNKHTWLRNDSLCTDSGLKWTRLRSTLRFDEVSIMVIRRGIEQPALQARVKPEYQFLIQHKSILGWPVVGSKQT